MCVANCETRAAGEGIARFIVYGIIVVIGAAIFAAFWGIWHAMFGNVPTAFGFSRFWLDTISGPIWAIAIVTYISYVQIAREEVESHEESDGSIDEFLAYHPLTVLVGIILAIAFAVSIFISFATIPVICIAVVGGYFVALGIWKLLILPITIICKVIIYFCFIDDEENEKGKQAPQKVAKPAVRS